MTAVAEVRRSNEGAGKVRRSPIAMGVIWGAIVLGVLLRVARWAHFRCLWLDEIYLAGSIVHRSLHDLLFRPLENWQAAPAGYLFLTHVSMQIFGTGERSLRLVSLVFGVASVPLMWAVCRRMLGMGGTAVAMAGFCVLGPLIYYSNEVKPYAGDVAVSLGITWSVLRWVERRSMGSAVLAAVVGGIGVFLSYPAVFVLAGAGGWAAIYIGVGKRASFGEPPPSPGVPLDRARGGPGEGKEGGMQRSTLNTQHSTLREGKERRWLGVILLVWGLGFLVDYILFVRPYVGGEAHRHVAEYWAVRDTFMPHSLRDGVEWIFSSLNGVAHDPGGMWLDYANAALVGLIVGVAIAIRRRGVLLLAVAPLPFVFAAAAARQYPFGDRLALFFVPQYLILIGAAAEALWTNFAGKAAAIAMVGLIVAPSGERALGYLFSPHGREESLPIYQWAAKDFREGDVVYLSHYAELSFDYYAGESGWPVDLRKAGAAHVQRERMKPEEIVADVGTCAGHRRVWVILIHPETDEFDVQGLTVAAFDRIGRVVEKREDFGAVGFLYDCSLAGH